MSNRFITSLFWKFFERAGIQLIYLILNLILARLLSPNEFGLVSIVLVFTSIASVFIQSGLNLSLIRNLDTTEKDYSTIFWTSFFIALLFYTIIFIFSNIIASFFQFPELTLFIKIVGLILFPNALNSVQLAYAAKRLEFKKLFVSSLLSTLLSGGISLYMALNGYGIWSLITLHLLMPTFNSLFLLLVIKWKPTMHFSWSRLKMHFDFGSKILFVNFVRVSFENIRAIIIGKKISFDYVAFYNKGKQFPQLIMDTVNGSIQSVVLPFFSLNQNEISILKKNYIKTLNLTLLLIFPMLVGLIIVGEPLILILLTEKWSKSVFFLQVIGITYLFEPVLIIGYQVLYALGYSKIVLMLDFFRLSLGMILIIFLLPLGIEYSISSLIFVNIISVVFLMITISKFLFYKIRAQVYSFIRILFYAIIMGIIVFSVGFLFDNLFLKIVFQVITGIISYILIILLIKPFEYHIIKNLISQFRKKTF